MKNDKTPEEEVTEEEFVAALVASGRPEEKAKFDAGMSKGLGASIKVGDRLLKIKQEIKPKKPRKTIKAGEADDYQIEQENTNHKHICIGGEMMTFIVASQLIRKIKNLGVSEAMDYIDNLPWLET